MYLCKPRSNIGEEIVSSQVLQRIFPTIESFVYEVALTEQISNISKIKFTTRFHSSVTLKKLEFAQIFPVAKIAGLETADRDWVLQNANVVQDTIFSILTTQRNKILQHVKNTQREVITEVNDLHTDIQPNNYCIITDISSGDKYVCHNETKSLNDMDITVLEEVRHMYAIDRSETQDAFCKVAFKPRNLELIWLEIVNGMEVKVLNSYVEPLWRKNIDQLLAQESPLVSKFLRHLFPIQEHRLRVYEWLNEMLTGRNETMFVLKGIKGNGKSTFVKMLIPLVGQKWSHKCSDSFFSSGFNSETVNKRLLFLDELEMDKKGHTKMKNRLNNMESIERKGVDVESESTETEVNYISMTNDPLYMESDDRRFLVPDLSNKKLVASLSEDEINELISMIDFSLDKQDIEEVSDELMEFGAFIIKNFSGGNKHKIIKSKTFYKMVEDSLPSWQKFVIDSIVTCTSDDEGVPLSDLEYNELKEKFKEDHKNRVFPNLPKFTSFVDNYDHEGNGILGEVIYNSKMKITYIEPKVEETQWQF